MRSVSVYIPKPGSEIESIIPAGSGIVASPYIEGGLRIDFESNKHHAENLTAFNDRLQQAARRHWEQLLTSSRYYLPEMDVDKNLIKVGLYHENKGVEYTSPEMEARAKDYSVSYLSSKDEISYSSGPGF